MKKQILIFTTLILAKVSPAFTMNPTWQQTVNKELLVVVKSQRTFSTIQEVQRLLDAGADPNAREEINIEKDQLTSEEIMQLFLTETPLHYAARRGHETVCSLLLKRGANVHATTAFGITPLMEAIEHPTIVKLLLAHGAQVNALTKYNYNALFYAAITNADSCVLLLEDGADPTIQSRENATPLMNAAHWYEGPRKEMCAAIVTTQARINTAIRTVLLCLNRSRNDPILGVLYRQFKTLLLPHVGNYIPLTKLLNMRNTRGTRAYDVLKIPCLDPENIAAIYAQNAIAQEVKQGWFSDCSIQ